MKTKKTHDINVMRFLLPTYTKSVAYFAIRLISSVVYGTICALNKRVVKSLINLSNNEIFVDYKFSLS